MDTKNKQIEEEQQVTQTHFKFFTNPEIEKLISPQPNPSNTQQPDEQKEMKKQSPVLDQETASKEIELKDFKDQCIADHLIGQGLEGEVYQVSVKGKKYAVQQYSSKSQQEINVLKSEIDLIAKVKGERIVNFYKHFFEPQKRQTVMEVGPQNARYNFYILMPLYETNLKQLIKIKDQSKSLTRQQRYQIGRGIAHGIAHLHSFKVSHGDLKPENILMNGRTDVFITDFGSVQQVNKTDSRSVHQTTAEIMTTQYASPQQFEQLIQTMEGDIWTLGAIMYELFALEDASQITKDQDFIITKDLNDESLKIILQKMLRHKPKDRLKIDAVVSYFDAVIM